jgi:SET domain-containing protein
MTNPALQIEQGAQVAVQGTVSPAVYRSPKIEVRGSPLQGLGVFAVQKIARGEVVAIKAGHIVTAQELSAITPVVGDLALQISENFYLSPKTRNDIDKMSVFINHSCEPNVGFDGQITYVAMRDIEPDEELFHDYAMERTDGYHLKCRCGASCCRGDITGQDWKNPALQQKYGNYFSSYILNKIRQQKETAKR